MKQKQKQEVERFLQENIVDVKTIQKQPWTCVVVTVNTGKCILTDYGFAKVRHPDVWDAEYGVELATNKAINSLVRYILNVPHPKCYQNVREKLGWDA